MLDGLPLGFKIIESPHMADRVQVRFPRSKKRRIRKKWAKRPDNWRDVPWDHYLIAHGLGGQTFVLMHPTMAVAYRWVVSRLFAAKEA